MAAITIADLNNAKQDADHIADIATSLGLTATDRLGQTKRTVAGAINEIALVNNRGAWVTATVYAVKDVVSNGGAWYICVSGHTSGATFAGDLAARWRVYQGYTAAELGVAGGGALVSTSHGGTGAATRTLQAKIREQVSIKDYGDWTLDLQDSLVKVEAASTGRVLIPSDIATLTLTSSAGVAAYLRLLSRLVVEAPLAVTLPEIDTTIAATTVFNGIGLDRITHDGAAPNTSTITGVAVVSNGVADHDATFNVSATTGMVVNGYCTIKSLTGTGAFHVLEGTWRVTAVGAGTVTVKVTNQKATMPALTVTGGTCYRMRTLLRYNGRIGFDVYTPTGKWFNTVLIGDGLGSGDIVGARVFAGGRLEWSGSTSKPSSMVAFKEHGVYVLKNGQADVFDGFTCSNGQIGVYGLQGAQIIATRLISTGNGTAGANMSHSCSFAGSFANLSGNGQRGYAGTGAGSSGILTSAKIRNNADAGVRLFDGAVADLSSATVGESSSYNVRAAVGAIVKYTSITYLASTGGLADEFREDNGQIGATQNINAAGVAAMEQIQHKGDYTVSVSIVDDGVYFLDINAAARYVRAEIIAQTALISQRGAVYARIATSHQCFAAADAVGITVAAAGTVLTGTTGTDGNFTVSAASTGLYLENRVGSARAFTVKLTGVTL